MPRDDPHRRTRARVRGITYLMLDITYNLSLPRSRTSCVNPAPRLRLCGFVLQKVNMARFLANLRGWNDTYFGRQAPRPPADFGRYGSLRDDCDGPAGEPPEDAPSGQPEGGDLWGDGGRQARRHGGPRAACERVLSRPGVRRGPGDQPLCLARPHGPARGPRAIRVREEGELAAHDPPRWVDRGEGETPRGECREAPPVLQSGRPPGDRRSPAQGREDDRERMPPPRPRLRLRADVVCGRHERRGICAQEGRHDHPDGGDPLSARVRRLEGGIPGRPEGDPGPRGAAKELRTAEPRDEGPLGRAECRRGLRRVPRARGARLPRRGLRVPRGPRDLEGRVPGEIPRGADGLRAYSGSEELPGVGGPRPPARASVVGLLRRQRETPGPLRGMVRQVLRRDGQRKSRSRSTRGRSTATSAACCLDSPALRRRSDRSSRSGGILPRRATCMESSSSSSTSG